MIGKLISLFSSAPESSGEVKVANDEQHDEAFQRAVSLITPTMKLLGRDRLIPKGERESVLRGIADLHAVTEYNPQNWAAFWFKGKGYQAVGNQEAANREFRASFALQRENPDVAREYAASCLELGLGEEGVRAAKHALAFKPEDAGLHANLALAFLIAGENEEAKSMIMKSLKMAPADGISRSVERIIDEVLEGRRKQPKFMADLRNSKTQKASLPSPS